MSHFCNTCIFWEKDIFTRPGGEKFGICSNTGVAMKVALDGKAHIEEEGTFYTEQYFGCVYWRQKNSSLINLSDVVKKESISKAVETKCGNCGAINAKTNDSCDICNHKLSA